MRSIISCVTNSLYYDQRMQRICSSLQNAGYSVTLVGRKGIAPNNYSKPVYREHRFAIWFTKGPLFYIEFQIRLFIYLIINTADIYNAADLDTLPAVYFAAVCKRKKIVFDAHEWFTQQKEVVTRKQVHRIWLMAEQWLIPKCQTGYTVNQQLANLFYKAYGVQYAVIRNVPVWKPVPEPVQPKADRWIIYQGAVNEGRCFEQLVPAMQQVDCRLRIWGNGNYMKQLIQLIQEHNLQNKVICEGMVAPNQLSAITPQATIGITLFEQLGYNQYYSLANRFFDYIMAEVPQVCSDFPEYASILAQFPVGIAVDSANPEAIAAALNKLLRDDVVYEQCVLACRAARAYFNWENEQQKLLAFYENV
ncbi:MAG: glycosyltransferase family 4 protein [Sediminibacterium sp.]|nr:glycosyltransferase family 4 protein [Sediminibacterium sp.]